MEPKGAPMEPTGAKMVSKWHPCRLLTASTDPKRFPMGTSTSCLHRFPLGAAVSRSAYNLVVILAPIFYYFLILFLNPQNLDFAIPYSVFEGFSIAKALILGPLLDHFFDPILGPPFEEPFGPPWPPKVPTLASPCRFWTLFGTPLGSKMAPWGTQGDPKPCTKWVLEATRVQKGSRKPFLSILGPPWVAKAPIWDPPA